MKPFRRRTFRRWHRNGSILSGHRRDSVSRTTLTDHAASAASSAAFKVDQLQQSDWAATEPDGPEEHHEFAVLRWVHRRPGVHALCDLAHQWA